LPPDQPDDSAARLQRLREIRAIGIAALHEGPGHLNLWDYLTELKALRLRGHKIEWREAKIALLVAMRERATQVVGSLNTLRALCQESDVPDRFTAFEALVTRSLGGIRLTNHAFGAQRFCDISHEPVWARVSAHLDALCAHGYEAFLNSGTLLGVVRDKRLIDHDDDIDLAVLLKARSSAAAAVEWLALRDRLHRDGLLDEAAITDPSILKLLPVEATQIDLFPAWSEQGRLFVYPHTCGELAVADVLPLGICEVTGNPVPADPEKMLALNYGADWRVPDPYFKFPWAQAKERFSDFLCGLNP